ncbi:hypothetical protein KK141_17310 [Dyella sp. LX-66]|uniref:hypothetical protein n=1 Tax=unclassified Dyella TaxID=2634549 RepID=UPI001BE07644|nr:MULTISPECIES: hypothetical protein [unclassified Dyella]MBT2117793.1 hypothetical protein [Dyella sp. LX-1]MBT2141308.1 hypothetical protein [Dyella sp. LX-66]
MEEVSHRAWQASTRHAFQKAILDCLVNYRTGSWLENTITSRVLEALGTADEVHWSGKPFRCAWKAFKASGPFETANGDIAMRVTLHTPDGRSLSGTKYFEAKKITPTSLRYEALDIEQLGRMQHTSGHEVLLYALATRPDKKSLTVEALCLPTAVAAMLQTGDSRDLHPATSSFVDVLSQALVGRGLNFDESQLTAFEEKIAAIDASFVLEANLAIPQLDLSPPMAPPGYEEFGDREPDPSDDLVM